MKTLIFAVGVFLLSALPVLAGPSAPDQTSNQFHALAALNGSHSATLQPLRPQTLKGEVLRFQGKTSDVIELTDAELNAVTGGNNGYRGQASGYGYGHGCDCGNGFYTSNYRARFY
jgi:hypothetical protein